jgi:Plasmid pRiA4b ORF-3-like protein
MEPAEIILKIALRGVRPPVWRRVRVTSDMTLRMLHQVIQEAMGWEDAHLHEFEVGKRRYGEPSDDLWPGMERTFSENGVRLGALVDQGVTRFRYVYDFGDGWEHEVVVEKVGPVDPEQQYPSLITGKRACPPEDCGGVYGYYRLLEVLADPSDEEHAELTEWVGGEFDPERLDTERISRALAGIARRRRPRGRRPRRSSEV